MVGGSGLLVPAWYRAEEPLKVSFALVTFLFGFSTACASFTAVTIFRQAHRTWRRSRRLASHPYIAMIAMEWLASVAISMVSYLFILDVIPPSFWMFFSILCIWVVQVQCSMHIIINRIALIMCDVRRVRMLKCVVTILIGMINISVFIVWIPARLQISSQWVRINGVWDRVEKGILLLIDLGLNLCFIYTVRAELIGHGLKKYWNLYWFNVGMIFVSISLDIILIGIMSLRTQSTFLYVQFHPLMYLVKLQIEMNMAELIIKIVKATSPPPGHELHHYAASNFPPPGPQRPTLPGREHSDTSTNTRKSSCHGGSSHTVVDNASPSAKHHPLPDEGQGWELMRLSSNFDAGDVVHVRRASVAESICAPGMVPMAASMRPPLGRNISELTELEIGAGYLDQSKRDGRKSGTVHMSPG